jgi:hypothetical protein
MSNEKNISGLANLSRAIFLVLFTGLLYKFFRHEVITSLEYFFLAIALISGVIVYRKREHLRNRKQ